MQRFNVGDGIFILPRFAHLYSRYSGQVTATKLDPFRPMFNEYTIEFPDGSRANLFEFQILEDDPRYQTFIAAVIFDSHQQAMTTSVRGQTPDRQVVLQSPPIDIDMKIRSVKSQPSIMGQVLETGAAHFLINADVTLLKDNIVVTATALDSLGLFEFKQVPRGSMNIAVHLHAKLWRLLGTFAV